MTDRVDFVSLSVWAMPPAGPGAVPMGGYGWRQSILVGE